MLLRPEFFATDEVVAQMEASLRSAELPPERLPVLLALAWQLRQRDCERALLLAEQVQALLAASSPQDLCLGPAEEKSTQARLDLLRAEIRINAGDLATAERQLQQAQSGFSQARDALGLGDAQWLEHWLWSARGQPERAQACNQAAQVHYAQVGDQVRLDSAKACFLFFMAFGDAKQAGLGLQREFPDCEVAREPVSFAWVLAAHALVKAMSGDSGGAARLYMRAFAAAEMCGQISLACALACNAGMSFSFLNDLEQALEWAERGLSLARARQWPARIGRSLGVAAKVLRMHGRFREAQAMLQESLELANSVADLSSNLANVQAGLAHLAFDMKEDQAALAWARDSIETCQRLGMREILALTMLVQAKALARLKRPQEALQNLQHLIELADESSNALWRLNALRVLSGVHAQFELPLPPEVQAGRAALYYCQQALDLARRMPDFILPVDLLEEAAEEYARAGDLQQAYLLALEAGRSRERIQSQQACTQAIALQVRFETERLRHEGERQRLLAQAHAERVVSLEQAHSTLEQLGVIGREITGNLEASAIIASLDRHVHALLDAFAFVIYRLEPDGQTLRTVFGLEDGVPLPQLSCRVDDERGRVPLCARERREIVAHLDAEDAERVRVEGTAVTLSMMFAPLLAGERLLGVMTIQTPCPHAYGEREIAIFRTLCAYGAIALANADSQAQLIQSEKMASLGQLVANVAHEINTPIGAVKSSGRNIADALQRTLEQLPQVLLLLDDADQSRFIDLIQRVNQPHALLSSSEERAQARALSQSLETAGIDGARHKAALLVQLRAHDKLEEVLPLLRHPQVELILDTAHSMSTIASNTENINLAVERVAKIVFALKSYSRFDQSEAVVEADLRQGLETVLTIYQSKLRGGVELVRNYQDLPRIPCLPEELSQVWTNLIHNALQAMQYKGVLQIRLERDEHYAIVVISDSGCGIPPELQERVFDPFFTTKPVGEGSGLGLDIVKKIIDKHRGRIELKSEVGVGSSFSVYLPLEAG